MVSLSPPLSPLELCWGHHKNSMPRITTSSRQRVLPVWSRETFDREISIAITNSLDANTRAAYTSALNSYLTFCQRHEFPIDPTIQTLSYYTIYMCHFIKPSSVDSYLSGIVSELEPYFPDVRANRLSPNIRSVLSGMKRSRGYSKQRARALTTTDLRALSNALSSSQQHDDLLFLTQVLSGVHGLLRSGEITQPDKTSLRDPRKNSPRSSAIWRSTSFGFDLTTSKNDKAYEGYKIAIMQCKTGPDPLTCFSKYVRSRDALHRDKPELWLKLDGTVPTYSWFVARLKSFFPDAPGRPKISGHSMRSGGATRLAQEGVPFNLIQAIGRWSSEAFRTYIRENPTMIRAMIVSQMQRTVPCELPTAPISFNPPAA